MAISRTLQKMLVGIFMVGALAACGSGGGSTTDVPVAAQTVKWQPDSTGYAQFMTNDTQWYGYGMWLHDSSSHEAQTSTVTATVIKKSGANNSGYGIIFCYQDSDNFYRVLIDTLGHYTVAAKVAGTYTTVIPWSAPQTATINAGYNVSNEISVTQTSPHNFALSFNGVQEVAGVDTNSFTGGDAGFYASVSSTAENFPIIPEDIRFKLTSPVVYPVLTTSGVQAAPAQQTAGAIESYEFGTATQSPAL